MFKKEQLFGLFLCTLLLLNTILIFTPAFPTAKAETGGPVQGEGTNENLTGNWTINASDTVYYGNRTLNMTGNLTIYGKLTLQNVTLRFNSTYNGQHGIYVKSGGSLVIRDNDGDWNTTGDGCNITAVNISNAFVFQVKNGSTFRMNNSELHYCGYEFGDHGKKAGLWVNANASVVEGNNITDSVNGVLLYDVNNCSVEWNNISECRGKDGVDGKQEMPLGQPGNVGSGVYIYRAENCTVANNIIWNMTGGDGGTTLLHGMGNAKSGGSGGISAGIYLSTSLNNNLTANNITFINGGKGGTGGYDGSGGMGGVGSAIYLNSSTNNNINANNISTINGGRGGRGANGGSGGVGGLGSAIYLNSSINNNITANNLSCITGGLRGFGGGVGSAGADNIGYGIFIDKDSLDNIIDFSNTINGDNIFYYFNINTHTLVNNYNLTNNSNPTNFGKIVLIQCSNFTIHNNTIKNFTGGPGNTTENIHSGGVGGIGAAIYLSLSTNNHITANNISYINGGEGGTGGVCTSGGRGGIGTAIYLSSSTNNNITANNITSINGGKGGTGGGLDFFGSGGLGGISSAIYLNSSTNNNITANNLSCVTGGKGGPTKFDAFNGADNIGYGIYIDEDSLDNMINLSNTMNGENILYYFNINSSTIIQNYNLTNNSNPTNLGKIVLIQCSNFTIRNNTISNFTGESGDTGKYKDMGKVGGRGAGIYLSSSPNNNITTNNITSIQGGKGGTGGKLSVAGSGGIGAAMYLSSSQNTNITANNIISINGGIGGIGGTAARGGPGGMGVAIYLSSSRNTKIMANNLSLITGGIGGPGNSNDPGGIGGIGTAIYLGSSQNTYITANNLSLITGGEGGIGGNEGPGGTGGIGAAMYFSSSQYTNITVNNLSSITGGKGGTGRGDGDSGGAGGISAAIYLSSSQNTNITANNLNSITGGGGGTGGLAGSGGTGGIGAGIWFSSSPNNNVTSNKISTMGGGVGGNPNGQSNEGYGIYLDENSLANNISPNNTIDGDNIIYFYNVSTPTIIENKSVITDSKTTNIGKVVLIESSNITLRNCTIANYTYEGDELEGGIHVKSGNNINLISNNITNTTKGIFLDNVNNCCVEWNNISRCKGKDGADGGQGEEGGIGSGVYLLEVENCMVGNNTVRDVRGGNGGGSSGHTTTGGVGGTGAGIYLGSSTGNNISSNSIMNITGGNGGAGGHDDSGGVGAIAGGIYLYSSMNNNITSNNITSTFGGRGGAGSSCGSDGADNIGYGIYIDEDSLNNKITSSNTMNGDNIIYYHNLNSPTTIENYNLSNNSNPTNLGKIVLIQCSNITVYNNIIGNFTGSAGGTGSPGDVGDIAAGIYLRLSTTNNITSNTITSITGGRGGTGRYGIYGSAGGGGTGAGIFLSSSNNNIVASNLISSLMGGSGGISGYEGSGGVGGIGAGIYLHSSRNNNITSNNITSIVGGRGGPGGGFLDVSSNGADNIGYGIYIDEDSLNNKITSSNTMNGDNIIYYYNISSPTTIENYNLSNNSNPTNFGKIVLVQCSNITVNNNTIANYTGSAGWTGGIADSGSIGAGIYLYLSTNNNITSNNISYIVGGNGGTGGWYNVGGSGGVGAGIYLSSNTHNNITSNIIISITGGRGGTGGVKGSGGTGGIGTGIYLCSSVDNKMISNNIGSIFGGVGGGGKYAAGGSGGLGSGIHLHSSTNNKMTSNTIYFIKGGAGEASGADNIGYGIYIDEDSLNNNITSSNTMNSDEIIYYYNLSLQITIENYNLSNNSNPTNFGKIVLIECSNITVRNNTIANYAGSAGGTGYPGDVGSIGAGVYIFSSINNNITSNDILLITGGRGGAGGRYNSGGGGGIGTGIYIGSSMNNNITSNTINSIIGGGGGGTGGGDGSGGSGGIGSGIYLYSSTNNNLILNNISSILGGAGGDLDSPSQEGFAIYVTSDSLTNNISTNNTIDDSPIHYYLNSSGINVSNQNLTRDNQPTNLGKLVFINCSNITITNNIISNFTGEVDGNYHYSGIFASMSLNLTISGNNISYISGSKGASIYLSDTNNTNITYNVLYNSTYGLYLENSCQGNTIYLNNFKNNTNHAYDDGNNQWDGGYTTGGNYWDDYDGVDNYSGPGQNISGADKIGDTAYNITGGNCQDRYPLMNPLDTRPPIAEAGLNQTVNQGDTVTLNGSDSVIHLIGSANYTWTFLYNSSLQHLYGISPSFLFEKAGYYIVTLNVTDAGGHWDTDSMTVTVNDTESPVFGSIWNSTLTTGDIQVFSLNITDNIEINIVMFNFTKNGISNFNYSVSNHTGDSWNISITLPADITTIEYYFWVNDTSNNWAKTSNYTLAVSDNDLPMFGILWYSALTTGDTAVFSANITDNIDVVTMMFNFTINGALNFNLSVTNHTGDSWNITITLPTDATAIDYYFWANDTSSNAVRTAGYALGIGDNDNPILEFDHSRDTGTTGDRFEFNISATDNIRIASVHVDWDHGDLSENLSLTENGIYWLGTITLDDNISSLTYVIHIKDPSNNLDKSTAQTVIITDNDTPTFLGDETETDPTTGDPFEIFVNVTDNIGVTSVYLRYTFDNVAFVNRSMMNNYTLGLWNITIAIPPNATYIGYTFIIGDAEGNHRVSPAVNVSVIDNDGPTAEAGSNLVIDQGTEITFIGNGSTDNIGIMNFSWSFIYNETEHNLSGERANFTFFIFGTYNVTMNISDKAGNWDIDYLTVTVRDVTPPDAVAGSDREINQHQKVTFHGNRSSDNVGIVNYTWEFTYDETIRTLYGQKVNFIFDIVGIYHITLNVTDEAGNWNTDNMDVTVRDITSPTAVAGNDQELIQYQEIMLNGGQSWDNVGIINYTWTFIYNEAQQELYGMEVNYKFNIPGNYPITLTVRDAMDNTATDIVNITVLPKKGEYKMEEFSINDSYGNVVVYVKIFGNGTLVLNKMQWDEVKDKAGGIPSGLNSLDIFFEITIQELKWVYIEVFYNDGDLFKDVQEESLRFYFWNVSAGRWEECRNSGVDPEANKVWGNATHLTIFVPMAQTTKKEADISTDNTNMTIVIIIVLIVMFLVIFFVMRGKSRKGKLPEEKLPVEDEEEVEIDVSVEGIEEKEMIEEDMIDVGIKEKTIKKPRKVKVRSKGVRIPRSRPSEEEKGMENEFGELEIGEGGKEEALAEEIKEEIVEAEGETVEEGVGKEEIVTEGEMEDELMEEVIEAGGKVEKAAMHEVMGDLKEEIVVAEVKVEKEAIDEIKEEAKEEIAVAEGEVGKEAMDEVMEETKEEITVAEVKVEEEAMDEVMEEAKVELLKAEAKAVGETGEEKVPKDVTGFDFDALLAGLDSEMESPEKEVAAKEIISEAKVPEVSGKTIEKEVEKPPVYFKLKLTSPEFKEIRSSIRNIIPDYIITHKIGSGGFATVYRALDDHGEEVAIKLPRFLDETINILVLEQFKAEAEMWKKLKHKNIVEFYKGDIRPIPYLVIEYMDGGNLKELMEKHKFSTQGAIEIMLQVLDGMSYAHKMASVHRDIKPENILFTNNGVPKISDWGIGKFMASEGASKSLGPKGTLSYSAPEQISKKKFGDVDWSTDVFQLGIIFYEMLTGEHPFYDDDPAGRMGKIMEEDTAPPSSLNSEIPKELDDIILKALQKQKENRWSSADVMFYELKRVVKIDRNNPLKTLVSKI